jgi:cell division protein FtsZ
MEEMNEIQEFMANFDQEVDVIWGIAFDNTLEDQIKVTVLASGFNVSLDKESSFSTVQQTERRTPEPVAPRVSPDKRLADEYGADAVTEMQLKQNKARYFVLTPDQMDDDDIIDMLEKNPTYGRKPDFRSQLKERQQAISPERPVEVPRAAKRAPSGDSQTIDFGE